MMKLHRLYWTLQAFFERNEKQNFRYYWAWAISFGWPALNALIFGFMAMNVQPNVANNVWGPSGYLGFLIMGTVTWSFVDLTFWQISFAFRREQWENTLEAIIVSPVKRIWVMVGNCLASIAETFVIAAIVFIVTYLVFGFVVKGSFVLLFAIIFLGMAAVLGFGIMLAAMTLIWKSARVISEMFITVLMFVSGVYYPISVLPDFLQVVAKLSPLTYVLDGTRKVALFGAGFDVVWPHMLALLIFTAALPIIGILIYNAGENYVRRKGTVSKY
jgi:ABC-2 type transport system permease protein